MRDMSKKQYRSALEKYGFKPTGFMGYYNLPEPCEKISVCSLNAGDNLRARLAYLLREYEKQQAKQ